MGYIEKRKTKGWNLIELIVIIYKLTKIVLTVKKRRSKAKKKGGWSFRRSSSSETDPTYNWEHKGSRCDYCWSWRWRNYIWYHPWWIWSIFFKNLWAKDFDNIIRQPSLSKKIKFKCDQRSLVTDWLLIHTVFFRKPFILFVNWPRFFLLLNANGESVPVLKKWYRVQKIKIILMSWWLMKIEEFQVNNVPFLSSSKYVWLILL